MLCVYLLILSIMTNTSMGTMIESILIFSLMEAAFLYKPFKEQARYVLGLVTILTTWNMFHILYIFIHSHVFITSFIM